MITGCNIVQSTWRCYSSSPSQAGLISLKCCCVMFPSWTRITLSISFRNIITRLPWNSNWFSINQEFATLSNSLECKLNGIILTRKMCRDCECSYWSQGCLKAHWSSIELLTFHSSVVCWSGCRNINKLITPYSRFTNTFIDYFALQLRRTIHLLFLLAIKPPLLDRQASPASTHVLQCN